MLTLAALALVAFAVTLVGFGLYEWFRVRRPYTLVLSALGIVLFVVFFALASRFALQLFGNLPVALDLRPFLLNDVLPLAIGALAGAAAIGLILLARRRALLAYALVALGALALVGLLIWSSQRALALAAQSAAAPPEHPAVTGVRAPAGFEVQVFAHDVNEPNALTLDDKGNLYYTELVDGNIVRLTDTDGDGVADEKKIFASGFKNPRGLAWRDGKLYVSSRGQINVLADTNGDGVADENHVLIDGLFSLDIQHSNNGITFGPDGRLYIANGGPRVHELEQNGKTYTYQGKPRDDWMFGGILVADADGKNLQLYAKGLRNPYALAFSSDGKLYATDNGDDTIPVPDGDELNLIEQGADYGYPYFFGIPPAWSDTRPPLIPFVPHSAPTGVVVYESPNLPKEYQKNVLVALYWHGRPNAHWREVVRAVPQVKDGKTTWVLKSFVDGLDRPTALAEGPDGTLYVADMRGGKADENFPGAIYRIRYVGK